jgi:hypothetical protein
MSLSDLLASNSGVGMHFSPLDSRRRSGDFATAQALADACTPEDMKRPRAKAASEAAPKRQRVESLTCINFWSGEPVTIVPDGFEALNSVQNYESEDDSDSDEPEGVNDLGNSSQESTGLGEEQSLSGEVNSSSQDQQGQAGNVLDQILSEDDEPDSSDEEASRQTEGDLGNSSQESTGYDEEPVELASDDEDQDVSDDQHVATIDQDQESGDARISTVQENEDMAVSINVSELGAILQRHAAKGTAGKQYNLTKTTENQRVSEIGALYRRIHGENPPQGALGGLLWLTLDNLQGENKATNLADIFPNQTSVSTKGVQANGTRLKTLQNIDAVLQALIKYVGGRDDLDGGQKQRYTNRYGDARDAFEPLIDRLKEEKKAFDESGELTDKEKALFGDLSYKNDLVVPLVDHLNEDVLPLLQQRGRLGEGDRAVVQHGVLTAFSTLIPPLRGGVPVGIAFVTEKQETVEFLTEHGVYNYILIKGDGGVQLVVHKTKNDGRSQGASYRPDVDAPVLDLPLGTNKDALRLDLVRSKASDTNRKALDTFARFGLNPNALVQTLVAYNDYLSRKHPENDPRYLFANLQNSPNTAKTLRGWLQRAVANITEREGIGAKALRKWYRNYIDGHRISVTDNRVIAKAMQHSLETAVGVYQKTNEQTTV